MSNLRLFSRVFLVLFSLTVFSKLSFANVPKPLDPSHPGSEVYDFQFQEVKRNFMNRSVEIFLPDGEGPFPVVVFGHGQAITSKSYRDSFIHLARKGVAVIFPMFDTGFFDQEWRRMAADFNQLAFETLKAFPEQLDPSRVIYSGHSKGAYVALVAAGSPSLGQTIQNVSSLVLFVPAGYDREYLQKINPDIPVSIFWGEEDSIVKEPLQREIFSRLPSRFKQFVTVRSYRSTSPTHPADHFYLLSEPFSFGGRKGISPFHYQGAWKWLIGASQDLSADRSLENPYIYGDEASVTGVEGLQHKVERSW